MGCRSLIRQIIHTTAYCGIPTLLYTYAAGIVVVTGGLPKHPDLPQEHANQRDLIRTCTYRLPRHRK